MLANTTIHEDATQLEFVISNLKASAPEHKYQSGNRLELPSYKAMLEDIVGEKVNEKELTIPWLFDETRHMDHLAVAANYRNSLKAYVDSDDEQHIQAQRESQPVKPPSKAGRPKGSGNKEKALPQSYRQQQISDWTNEDELKLLEKFNKCKGYLNRTLNKSLNKGAPVTINTRGKIHLLFS